MLQCPSMTTSRYRIQELETAYPEWYQDTQAVHPKRIEHHQSGHLTKDAGCPVCMEEGADRQPGIMHVDLAAFEASADGNKYCLVAAVTIEVDKESKLLPIFVPMPKKDAACALAAIIYLSVKTAIYIKSPALECCEYKQVAGEFSNEKLKALCWEKNIILSFSPAHQPSSNGIAERMVGILKSTVRRTAKAGKSRERMVVLCVQVCRPHDERESSRTTMAVSSIWSTCGNMEVSRQSTSKVSR